MRGKCGGGEQVTVVTHALTTTGSSFWELWKSGAEAAAKNMRVKLDWQASGYVAATHVSMIKSACKDSVSVVVTIPFESTTPDCLT